MPYTPTEISTVYSDLNYVFSAVSCFFSFIVIVSILRFHSSLGKKLFMKIILMIAFSEIMFMIGNFLGFPLAPNPKYYAKEFLNGTFIRAQWFWTVALTYETYSMILYNKPAASFFFMNLTIWPISICFGLPGLTAHRFGIHDDMNSGNSWCDFHFVTTPESVWYIISYVVTLYSCLVLMLYCLGRIYYVLSMSAFMPSPAVLRALDALKFYPCVILFVWTPAILAIQIHQGSDGRLVSKSQCFGLLNLSTQSGTLTGLIFLWKTREVRNSWMNSFGMKTVSDDELDLGEDDDLYTESPPTTRTNSVRGGSVMRPEWIARSISDLTHIELEDLTRSRPVSASSGGRASHSFSMRGRRANSAMSLSEETHVNIHP